MMASVTPLFRRGTTPKSAKRLKLLQQIVKFNPKFISRSTHLSLFIYRQKMQSLLSEHGGVNLPDLKKKVRQDKNFQKRTVSSLTS